MPGSGWDVKGAAQALWRDLIRRRGDAFAFAIRSSNNSLFICMTFISKTDDEDSKNSSYRYRIFSLILIKRSNSLIPFLLW